MLLEDVRQRRPGHDLWLGGTTASVAGMVNVCCVIAFFAFGSNVTGHVAIFAEELVKGHWHQMSVVVIWLLMFIVGAAVANFSVTALGARSSTSGRLVPLVIEALLLIGVGYYGHHHYAETLRETEVLVGAVLLAMGMQNGLVATVSRGLVKTTHLTGLATDLGIGWSLASQPGFRRAPDLRFKLRLHIIIFAGYTVGGIMGGFLFLRLGFQALYATGVVLGFIFVHDVVTLRQVTRKKNATAASAGGTDQDVPGQAVAPTGAAPSPDFIPAPVQLATGGGSRPGEPS